MNPVSTRCEAQTNMARVELGHCYTYTGVDYSNCGRAHLHLIYMRNTDEAIHKELRKMSHEQRREVIYKEVYDYLSSADVYYADTDNKTTHSSRRWLITMSDSANREWLGDLPKNISVFGFAMWCMKNHPRNIQAMPVSHVNNNSRNPIAEFTFMPSPESSQPLKDVVENRGGVWHGK